VPLELPELVLLPLQEGCMGRGCLAGLQAMSSNSSSRLCAVRLLLHLSTAVWVLALAQGTRQAREEHLSNSSSSSNRGGRHCSLSSSSGHTALLLLQQLCGSVQP